MLDRQICKSIVSFEDRWFFISTKTRRALGMDISETMVYVGNSDNNVVSFLDKFICLVNDTLSTHTRISDSLRRYGKWKGNA